MTELVIAEEHSQIYDLWLERKERNLSVCHIDFHCDMRGLLIDRRSGRARFVTKHIPYVHRNDSGSYLSHAIMNGIVTKLRWVHDEFGGREYDYVHCVKYESDFTALPYRRRRSLQWQPIDYVEQTFESWGGPLPEEQLDIDWDGLAHADYDLNLVRQLTAQILDRQFSPKRIFLARSPGYSNPDLDLFEGFIAQLERKFHTRALRLQPPPSPKEKGSRWWSLYSKFDRATLKVMHELGLH
ncbi:hypothetical protein [Geomesophilobacter sediminis]|uniref:Uncharacterized protein n=1 Tax=Geomesophilobacter sediminis TaxID=2798584 RepID=A0A8J7M245_9BACT|nr:hypothetical protein [Geomesophilobacter sediminis]MBJ6727310.1 hypothetical protein [Geomesophilobacter sediminis]